ncbi:tachykinin-4 isoform X4 [Leptonychotes weddellii]|uniref:Tachykinin-4 isoform X4 n=1 Tax=Leptonychotes weddellii TaxID=9713 RepID=A0A7F8Q2C8_LEPWE|nr:tachykinin-4 isoform X4 [Leptonychotes weddellii]XP_035950844.1 tachykinin-4 isoform X2 [Halichoerus grypus]
MLPCLPMLLLMGLSAGTVTADEGLALGAEAGSWITLTLEDGGIHLQLQEVKRGKASQFFGLMGKQVRGIPPIQPDRTAPPPEHPQGQMVQGLLGRAGPSTEGREDEEHGSE